MVPVHSTGTDCIGLDICRCFECQNDLAKRETSGIKIGARRLSTLDTQRAYEKELRDAWSQKAWAEEPKPIEKPKSLPKKKKKKHKVGKGVLVWSSGVSACNRCQNNIKFGRTADGWKPFNPRTLKPHFCQHTHKIRGEIQESKMSYDQWQQHVNVGNRQLDREFQQKIQD